MRDLNANPEIIIESLYRSILVHIIIPKHSHYSQPWRIISDQGLMTRLHHLPTRCHTSNAILHNGMRIQALSSLPVLLVLNPSRPSRMVIRAIDTLSTVYVITNWMRAYWIHLGSIALRVFSAWGLLETSKRSEEDSLAGDSCTGSTATRLEEASFPAVLCNLTFLLDLRDSSRCLSELAVRSSEFCNGWNPEMCWGEEHLVLKD